jgi:hypothetical protein
VKKSLGVAILLAVPPVVHQEPVVRRLNPIRIEANAQFMTVSGVRELKNGQLLVTDANKPAIYLIDPKSGTSKCSAPRAPTRGYVHPGGVYASRGIRASFSIAARRESRCFSDRTLARIRSIKASASRRRAAPMSITSALAVWPIRGRNGRLAAKLTAYPRLDSARSRFIASAWRHNSLSKTA